MLKEFLDDICSINSKRTILCIGTFIVFCLNSLSGATAPPTDTDSASTNDALAAPQEDCAPKTHAHRAIKLSTQDDQLPPDEITKGKSAHHKTEKSHPKTPLETANNHHEMTEWPPVVPGRGNDRQKPKKPVQWDTTNGQSEEYVVSDIPGNNHHHKMTEWPIPGRDNTILLARPKPGKPDQWDVIELKR